MRYFLCTVSLGILLAGCSRKDQPILSHGKPVAHWVEELQQPVAKARKKAVVALGHVGASDPAVIPALIGAVKDRDVAVRSAAILALLTIGPDAKAALDVLAEAQNDPNAQARSYAAKAVERIQPGK